MNTNYVFMQKFYKQQQQKKQYNCQPLRTLRKTKKTIFENPKNKINLLA